MELSPSGSNDDGNPSSSLLALLDEHNVRPHSKITLGELVSNAQGPSSIRGGNAKRPRFKLTDNGFTFRFDKNSVCGERQFWRCERKSDCAARIHTDMKGTIVKRINYHTHPAQPDPDQVVLPRKKARMAPSEPSYSMEITQGGGVLQLPTFDAPSHDNQDLLHMSNGGVHGLLQDTFIKEEDMGILNEPLVHNLDDNDEETGGGHAEISPMLDGHGMQMPAMSDDFWRVFNLTKKVFAVVKKEMRKDDRFNDDDEMADDAVAQFLNNHRFGQFTSKLRRYSMMDLRELTVAECKEVLEDVSEGVRMHKAIRSEWGELTNGGEKTAATLPTIKVYLAAADETNPVHKMITLPEGKRSLLALREGLTRRGVLDEGEMTAICVNEGALTVELCDDMLEEWSDQRVFTYRRSGEYLVLEPSQSM